MILVFGQSGQVARELARADHTVKCLSRADADLMNPTACADIIRAENPTAVINAAAYTNVDGAESDAAAAHIINGDSPTAMAQVCADLKIPFVHISTDYVFPGAGERPWQPDDQVGPLGVYGASKLAGEQGVRAAAGTHAILRTSWVFSAHGHNFVKTMLRLGAEREALTIVDDQIGGPTSAASIAACCLRMVTVLSATPEHAGVYHFSGAPAVSWADFAKSIFRGASISCAVKGIPTQDYPTLAQRPLNSRMDCSATHIHFGIALPNWQADLQKVLKELGHDTA